MIFYFPVVALFEVERLGPRETYYYLVRKFYVGEVLAQTIGISLKKVFLGGGLDDSDFSSF